MANNNRNQQDSAQKGQGKTGKDAEGGQDKKQNLAAKGSENQSGKTKQGAQSKEKKSDG